MCNCLMNNVFYRCKVISIFLFDQIFFIDILKQIQLILLKSITIYASFVLIIANFCQTEPMGGYQTKGAGFFS